MEEAWEKPMGGQRLDPETDLVYAESVAGYRAQLGQQKGRKIMAEGPQRRLTTAMELGGDELSPRVWDPPTLGTTTTARSGDGQPEGEENERKGQCELQESK